MLWRKIKQRKGLEIAKMRDRFTVLNKIPKEVVNQKVEFEQSAGMDKKASICVSM